jgi:formylglycine-generating enzyme required for sulfatase activity
VLRGGAWNGNANYCRVADRSGDGPADRYGNGGFRISLDF